ncbi:MAG: hypothetical protein E7194_00045 [Erysipelotrichaceae bacterium]|nr:hypothetical protein [Erysipelotrichaceae bacterium]
MGKQKKNGRQETEQQDTELTAASVESYMLMLKHQPEAQLPYQKRVSKYARKKMLRNWNDDGITKKWK